MGGSLGGMSTWRGGWWCQQPVGKSRWRKEADYTRMLLTGLIYPGNIFPKSGNDDEAAALHRFRGRPPYRRREPPRRRACGEKPTRSAQGGVDPHLRRRD